MAGNAGWFLVGLIALAFGAEVMVRGGAQLASRLGISPMMVGLTVVSIGTSLPELAVGITAALEGSGELAVGNIAGTNVVNVLFILGLSALLRPLAIERRTLRFDLPAMAAAAVLLWALSADGVLSRLDGTMLVVGALVYTAILAYLSRQESRDAEIPSVRAHLGEANAVNANQSTSVSGASTARLIGMTVAGIAVVVLGAEWLVDGAVGLARGLGVSDALIGLTIVAIGTSAPELVTMLVSTMRGERDIALGNLLGSSVYNVLLILGVTCLVPAYGLTLSPALVWIDIPIMMAAALVCIPIFFSGRRVHRAEGFGMVVAYLLYLAFLLSTQA
ncbi:calcium/sodium antiporter [Mycolicibacterium wolinskyi]|uniref:Sodium:calcium antiporter n=2 Tax=Mycolicibacterium wolinskyi TaxID=59750 RepID=A0A1X2FEP3_9MYCO|nr:MULTISPECIES: calcium/sodium antiporter [Mycolicibacterium]MCV7290574.1 calcium/sodium antiporter [Mycolicibacterium wolinskyi]MCV7291624.1 calcium/sodium antiporter [Mycolicibacterium goodii]ORX16903.1 sodium:calcium antiporter [Mycolicibacterium wolinskyi]